MREHIVEFITREFTQPGERFELEDDTDLIESGIVDSFGLLKIVAFLEDELGVAIDAEDLTPSNFQTLAALVRLIEKGRLL